MLLLELQWRLFFLLDLEEGLGRVALTEESMQLVLVMELFILLVNPEEADFLSLELVSAESEADLLPFVFDAFIILTNNIDWYILSFLNKNIGSLIIMNSVFLEYFWPCEVFFELMISLERWVLG